LALLAAGALALTAGAAAAAEPQHGAPGGAAHGGGGGGAAHPGGGAPRGGGGAPHGGGGQPAGHSVFARPAPTHTEPHPGPSNYQRPPVPQATMNRPQNFDRGAYNHNFQASRTYHVGGYRRPSGWMAHRWSYGEFLPRAYWADQYFLAEYWLFGLEVPPVGYEWVRDDDDAILINVQTGEILQVEYGVFG
jgi:Ni/Co efflux regulator RcnB